MSELLCPGPLTVESEFQIVPGTTSHPPAQLTGACGPNAASHAARCASGNAQAPDTVAVYRAMRGLNLGESNGVSNACNLRDTLTHLGYTLITPNAGEGVQAFCARLAGHAPIVLEVANGQAFRDELTGATEDAGNLQYHFVCLLGRNTGGASARKLPPNKTALPAGYWVADGDNNVQNPVENGKRVHRGMNGDLVYYSDATVAAAKPYSAFAVAMKEAPVSNPNPTPLELSQWHELQADRAQIATLKQQLAAVQAQSVKQYQEILANRAQILRQNATIASLQQQLQNVPPPDPVAADLLAAVRRAAGIKSA